MKNKYLRKSINLLSILIVGLFLNACSLFGENAEFTENSVKIIAGQGGVVENAAGDVLLDIPAGALSQDEDIEISSAVMEEAPEELRELVNAYGDSEDGAVFYRLEPDGLEFDEPVTITFEIDADEITQDGVPDFILISQSERGEPEYVQDLHVEFDAETGKYIVSGTIEHFSWVVRVKSFLKVQLEQIEPRIQAVREEFNISIEIKNISPTYRFKYENIEVQLHLSGPVIYSGIENLKYYPIGLNVARALLQNEQSKLRINLECTAPGMGGYYLRVTADEIHLYQTVPVTNSKRLTVTALVECVAPTEEPTETKEPTKTVVPSPTVTPTQTMTPTETLTPTPTLTPTSLPTDTPTVTATPVEISGTVNVGTASCRYGPSSSFLFLYGLAQGEPVVVWGQNSGWLLVKPDFYASPCWIWSGLLDLNASIVGLAFNAYTRILPRDYTYSKQITGFAAVRSGANINLTWQAAAYILQADLYGYLGVFNLCQNGLMLRSYQVFSTNSGSVSDDGNCGQSSSVTLYVIHKHGYGPELNRNLP